MLYMESKDILILSPFQCLGYFHTEHEGAKIFENHLTSDYCHVGIHWKALAEYSQMSTHVPGFESFFSFFASFSFWPN